MSSSGSASAAGSAGSAAGSADAPDGDGDPGGSIRKRLRSGAVLHPDNAPVKRSRTTLKKQPAASGSSNAEGKLPAAVGVAVGVAVEQGVSVENALAPSGPLPRFAAALPVDDGAAAAKKWQDDEEARRMWAEEGDSAQREYDEQWLTERRPTLEYISKGEQYVADKTVPIFRLQGEVSACQAMTSRLGAPTGADLRTDAAWRWLNENEWMDALIDEAVDAAPEERKVGVGEELREIRRDLGSRDVPLLRKFAQAMYTHKDDLHACHGWCAQHPSGTRPPSPGDSLTHESCRFPTPQGRAPAQRRAVQHGTRHWSSARPRRRRGHPAGTGGRLPRGRVPRRFS